MYVQPFLLGTLALSWARLGRGWWRWPALAPLLLVALASARTQQSYVKQSFGSHSSMVEQKSASEDGVFRRLRADLKAAADADHLVVATDSSFAAKAAISSNNGRPLRTPVFPFIPCLTRNRRNLLVHGARGQRLMALSDAVIERFPEWEF